MSPEPSSARLAQLREVVEKDAKSRLFVQLADEYRRIGQAGEAIAVLRRGLEHHPGYVAAWTALGKLYVESGRDHDAIPSLEKVLSIDPQNVVAARVLGDIHLRRGQKVEAIKRYKLVKAIAPGDRELDERIAELERSVGADPAIAPLPAEVVDEPAPPTVATPEAPPTIVEAVPAPEPVEPEEAAPPFVEAVEPPSPESPLAEVPFAAGESAGAGESFEPEIGSMNDAVTVEPAEVVEEARPEPSAAGADDFESEAVSEQVEPEENIEDVASPGLPLAAAADEAPFEEVETDEVDEARETGLDSSDVWRAAAEESLEDGATGTSAAATETLTMAELYLRQGHADRAREILERLAVEHPEDPRIASMLKGVPSAAEAAFSAGEGEEGAVGRLRGWLEKIQSGSARG